MQTTDTCSKKHPEGDNICCWGGRGVAREEARAPPNVDWVDILTEENWLCWDCSLYQKCSVGIKYAKNALAAGDPAGGAHDAPQTPYPTPGTQNIIVIIHSFSDTENLHWGSAPTTRLLSFSAVFVSVCERLLTWSADEMMSLVDILRRHACVRTSGNASKPAGLTTGRDLGCRSLYS